LVEGLAARGGRAIVGFHANCFRRTNHILETGCVSISRNVWRSILKLMNWALALALFSRKSFRSIPAHSPMSTRMILSSRSRQSGTVCPGSRCTDPPVGFPNTRSYKARAYGREHSKTNLWRHTYWLSSFRLRNVSLGDVLSTL